VKLREEEFYEQYHQHGGTTIIPTEIFNELYDDATEEIERLNNIIKEIEDFCIAMGKMYEEDYKDTDIASIFNICILNKIKELKGVDKE